MEKFRNMLVHIYWEIDDAMGFKIIQKDLKDLKNLHVRWADHEDTSTRKYRKARD